MTPHRLQLKSSRRSPTQSVSFARQKRERIILVSGAGIMLAIILVFASSYITSLPLFAIRAVEVHGADTETNALIHESVSRALGGSYIGLFSKSNVFIYPRKEIASTIEAVLPRVENVETKMVDRRTISITVKEKDPAAVICSSLPDFDEHGLSFETGDTCYFADRQAFIYKEAPAFFGAPFRRFYVPSLSETASTTTPIGQSALPEDEFDDLTKFYDAALDGNLKIQALFVKGEGEYELYAEHHASTVVIYLSKAGDFSKEITNLLSFWSNMTEGVPDEEQPRFESIDVRYGSNVFYRLSQTAQ